MVAVENIIVDYLINVGYDKTDKPPLKNITIPISFKEKRRRYFYLLRIEDNIAVVENGDMADENLAHEIFTKIKKKVYWIAYHDAVNAWGRIVFDGSDIDKRLFPKEAFIKMDHEDFYEGDAYDEVSKFCDENCIPFPMLTYHTIPKLDFNMLSIIAIKHISFFKPS